ncbi:MAG: S8 family serine peptidase [bacterium]
MKIRNSKYLLAVLSLAAAVSFFACKQRTTESKSAQNNFKLDRPSEPVLAALTTGRAQRLLVVVKHDSQILGMSESMNASSSDSAVTARAARFRSLKQVVLDSARSKKIAIDDSYSHLPILKVSAKSVNDLTALANDPNVVSISEDVKFKFNSNSNLNLIRQPEAVAKGFLGDGASVAILDTGLDYMRTAFGSCTAPNTPADTCRVSVVQDFAPADNVLDDSILHGTNVAGIVAAVAPGAKLIGLDVFDGDGAYGSDIIGAINWVIANKSKYNIASMNMSFGSYGFVDCLGGSLAVAISTAKDAGVLTAAAAGNMGSIYLDYPACSPSAVSVGAVFDSDIGSVDFGCTEKQASAPDKIACFSSFSPDLKMLAPGVQISAAGITMSGTSQATPHVAAAIGVLKSAFPSETPDQLQDRLAGTGKIIVPPSYPLLKLPRLDLAAALGPRCQFVLPPKIKTLNSSLEVPINTGSECKWSVASEASWITVASGSGKGPGSFILNLEKPLSAQRLGVLTISGDAARVSVKVIQPLDAEPPNGSFVIGGNRGNQYTSDRRVSLIFNVTDISGIDSMCVSNTTSCSNFVPFSQAYSWDLSSGDGVKTVYVFLRDKLGNTTKADQPLKSTIILDTTAPTAGRLIATKSSNDLHIDLEWDGFIDNETEIKTYTLVYSATKMPQSCAEGDVVYSSYGRYRTHGPLSPGTYYYRVCAKNAVDLTSAGVTTSFRLDPVDVTPPVGSVKINSGDVFARNTAASLSIEATDPSGVAKMCVSLTSACSSWENFANSKAIVLSKGQGIKTVNVWFEDGRGNRTINAVKDDIILDSVAPTTGKITGRAQGKSAILNWNQGSDANGIASYRLVYKRGADAPRASCTDGAAIAVALGALTATVPNLASKNNYGFRVCAVDYAGNISSGTTVSVRIP